uniref:Beta-lactoglobulin II variant B n=1 Tax=Equus asinus TaxID=9793 RepID=D6QX31_EQUAS|nr:beta-lactoglobulin II variant B [Equus asinus]
MKCLLLALGLSLMCGNQATDIPQTMQDLDLQEVAGRWHSVAMVASDISLLDSESAPLRVYVEELRPTPEGNLEIILREGANHVCVERNIVAQKTEDPAVFTVNYQGERKISVLDTDYAHYMFFCVGPPLPSAEHGTVCQYLARTQKVDEEVMEKFSRALQPLPGHVQIIQDPSGGQERCGF